MRRADHDHFGRIAHLMTPPRRRVLELLRDGGAMTVDEIAAAWAAREPDMSRSVATMVPQMVSQSLWKLENLGLVARDDAWTITPAGIDALRIADP